MSLKFALLLLLASASTSANLVAGGEISEGFLEINDILDAKFPNGLAWQAIEDAQKVILESSMGEDVKHPDDLRMFAEYDLGTCSMENFEQIKKMVELAGAEDLRTMGHIEVDKVKKVQLAVRGLVRMHALACSAPYNDERRMLTYSMSRETILATENLNQAANYVCGHMKGISLTIDKMQPSKTSSASYYQCVRESPRILVELIKQEVYKQARQRVSAKDKKDRKSQIVSIGRKVGTQLLNELTKECKIHLSVFHDLVLRLDYDSTTDPDTRYSAPVYDAWIQYSLCNEFMKIKKELVIALTIDDILQAEEKKKFRFSRLFNCKGKRGGDC